MLRLVPKRMKVVRTRHGKRNEKIKTTNSTQKTHGSDCDYIGEVYEGFTTDSTQPTSLTLWRQNFILNFSTSCI
jgi:hypothetical protein